MLSRIAVFSYGAASYAVFFATFLYACGFVGNFVVPKSIDSGATMPFAQALMIDTALLAAFALQHSIMARRPFKRMLTRFIPEAAERSTYVLASSLALIAMFVFWQPLGGTVWSTSDPVLSGILYTGFAAGWLIVLVSTFLINHFDLFGLRQVWLYLMNKPYTHLPFKTPFFYRYVRHPLYFGWLLAFWMTPVMTAAHLFFAIMTTSYILIAIQLEERDLVTVHGETYRRYRDMVPMIIPVRGPAPHPTPSGRFEPVREV